MCVNCLYNIYGYTVAVLMFLKMCGLKKDRFERNVPEHLLAASIFGNSFCSFANCVFSQLSGKEKSNSSLDFTRRDGGFLVLES